MVSSFSKIRFQSDDVIIGTFYCPANHPSFNSAGEIDGYTIVFPRTSVMITHNGRSPVVADPNVIMFYNLGQRYQRDSVSRQGDLCDWLGFSQTAVLQAFRRYDPTVDERQLLPFCFTHGPSHSRIYVAQRLLIHSLQENAAPDLLETEERALDLLDRSIALAYQGERPYPLATNKTSQDHLDLVQAVKVLLAKRFREALTLSDIATAVYSSPYHLSRIFRHYTGFTIHKYLNQLRLRTALHDVAQTNNLADLGLSLGYSSHSHFSQAFRHAFGASPSAFRDTASTARIREMSNFLTA